MEIILTVIVTNVLSVVSVFCFVYFVATRNKDVFSKNVSNINKRLDDFSGEILETESKVSDVNKKLCDLYDLAEETITRQLKTIVDRVDNLEDNQKELKQESGIIKEFSKKVSEQHEDYHDNMLEKLNKAGELIVGYETFFENTLAELEEIIRFVDSLSKRPALSSDPDFANFSRAIQLMVQTVEKYSLVAGSLRKESRDTKTD